jgi:hypothetical protein
VTARDKAVTKSIQRTADAAASNAAKLEKARGLAVDRILKILSEYPEEAGDELTEFGKGEHGKKMSNRYSLLNLVTAIDKLSKYSANDAVDDPVVAMLKRWDDASTGQ